MTTQPRAYTEAEVRQSFLNYIHLMVDYWDTVDSRPTKEKLSGLAFSILNIFDGTTVAFPAMNISLAPHKDDKQYHIDEGSNWFEPNMVINGDVLLHEQWYSPDLRNPLGVQNDD